MANFDTEPAQKPKSARVIKSRPKPKGFPESNATVQECLQYQHLTPFQTLVSELKNTVMKSYWNKEVGKTHYLVPYLPMGMDPVQTTFGKKFKSDATVAELINPIETDQKIVVRKPHVDHCRFQETSENEGEQIKRNYNCHFNEHNRFGKKSKASIEGSRIKKIIKGGEHDVTTLVNHIQADFLKRTQLNLGKVKHSDTQCLSPSITYGKPSEKQTDSVAAALKESPTNDALIWKWNHLRYLHSLRDRLKTRIPNTHFLDIHEDLARLDKEHTGTLPTEVVLSVFGKYSIYPESELFGGLLDILKLQKNGELRYKNVVDILHWKCPFPTLPITKNKANEENIISSPVNEENKSYAITPKCHKCDDEKCSTTDNAYALIFPSIFTKYNLHHIDFFKIRSKEEIRNIFENIGTTLPNNSFDMLWEKGLEKDGADGVCVDTFNTLVDSVIIDSNKSK